jgi:hypothetical protein
MTKPFPLRLITRKRGSLASFSGSASGGGAGLRSSSAAELGFALLPVVVFVVSVMPPVYHRREGS